MKKIFIIISLIALGVIFLGATFETEHFLIKEKNISKEGKTIQKSFDVKPGGKVMLDLKTGGSIQIQGWNKDVVEVNADISGKDADDVKFEVDQNENEISIYSYYDGDEDNNSCREKVIVNVPQKFNVEFKTMGGNVKLDKLEGELEGKTMGGQLELSNLKGNVNMTTMGGRINVSDCEIDGKVKTMGGEVLVENVVGDLDASSMGGKVIQKNVKGNKNSIGKEVNISTMGGEINVDNAPNGAKLKTMGGDITINSASKFVDAVTYGGNIEINEVDGKVKAKTFGGDVDVKFTGSGEDKDIEITSLGGDINLSVPENFSMDVYVEIAITKDWGRKHKNFEDLKVNSDFKLNEERSDDWDYSHGSPRKYLYSKGSFNGGKNKVVVKTINGEVTFRKN